MGTIWTQIEKRTTVGRTSGPRTVEIRKFPPLLNHAVAEIWTSDLRTLETTIFPSRRPKSAQSKTQVLLSCLLRYCPHLPACYYLPQPKTQECPVEDPSVTILPVAILPSFLLFGANNKESFCSAPIIKNPCKESFWSAPIIKNPSARRKQ